MALETYPRLQKQPPAATGGVLYKNVFLKNLQNPQENTCASVSFNLRPATFLKKRLWHRCFPVNFAKFQEHLLCGIPPGDCFYRLVLIDEEYLQATASIDQCSSMKNVGILKYALMVTEFPRNINKKRKSDVLQPYGCVLREKCYRPDGFFVKHIKYSKSVR